jgi:AcrR family transcriptional regulator
MHNGVMPDSEEAGLAREDQKNRSENVRQAIIDTALQIGLKEGFEAVSIRKISGRMKYSTGVVYHYFKEKQEIIDAIEASETEKYYGVISKLVDDSADAAANIVTVFRQSMHLALKEPEKYNLIVLHKYSRHSPRPSPWIGYIIESLKRDMQAGKVRVMDARKAAFSIWSSFLGFNLMISRLEGLAEKQAEAMFDVQVDIILKGVLKP